MLARRWNGAPRWVLCSVLGVIFAVPVASMLFVLDPHPRVAGVVLGGVVGGLFFGGFMGTWLHRTNGRFRTAVGATSASEHRVLGRIVQRGEAPEDPELRLRVQRVAVFRLEEQRRQRPLLLTGYALLLILFSVSALIDNSLYWLAVASAVGLLAAWLWQYRRLERLVAALKPPAEG
ncbi:MAG: hypothetical protein QOG60_1058 [Frankiaceae bacterium]|nr:hypothetical protein [Frankiaceae bacterium]